jgi:hypothetical protein
MVLALIGPLSAAAQQALDARHIGAGRLLRSRYACGRSRGGFEVDGMEEDGRRDQHGVDIAAGLSSSSWSAVSSRGFVGAWNVGLGLVDACRG